MPETKPDLPILAFACASEWEKWLRDQPRDSKGIWLKLAKKESGIASVSKAEAIDLALCYGWIDGKVAKFDDKCWLLRFTPRRPKSKWSAVNRKRVLELIEEGKMQSAGLAEVEQAKADGRWDAAYEPQSTAQVPPDFQAALDASATAGEAFKALNSVNRFAMIYRVNDAKKPETRAARIEKFVGMLERGEVIYPAKNSK